MGSAFRHIAHARAILKEQCGQPLLSQRIVPRKVMVQPREAQLGMPVARYVAPERDRDTGREVSGRRPPQVVLADLPQAANERACAHEVLAGVETQQFRNIRNRPITAEYPAQGRLRVKGSVHDSSMIPRLPITPRRKEQPVGSRSLILSGDLRAAFEPRECGALAGMTIGEMTSRAFTSICVIGAGSAVFMTPGQSSVIELVYQSGASTNNINFSVAKITLERP